jgi:drug/metabolite transporter (DMT)-like permease
MPYLGEASALLTAVCWTVSSTAFAVASRAVGPLPANQFRLFAALPVLFVLARLLTGGWWPVGASAAQLAWLVSSGVAGLVVGDLGYFYALAKIGPRLCSVVMACWPACAVALEALAGRLPAPMALAGIGMTMAGVTVVLLRSRDGARWNPTTSRRQFAWGLAGALLGAVGQAVGFVFAGYGMQADGAAAAVDPLSASVVRMTTAVVGLQVFALWRRQPIAVQALFDNGRAMRAALLGALCGPIGGVWLSMVARARASDAGVAAALMATTPVFMMPVAVWLYRAPVGRLGVLGTLLAVAGVGVCFVAR